MDWTIEKLKYLKESEDRVEFKATSGGSYSYNGSTKADPKARRKCILGYVVALANEGGGLLVFGMSDKYPHSVVGSKQNEGNCGLLEQSIFNDLEIRVSTQELYDEQGLRVLVIQVASRPIGKVLKFDDVPLMRVGEELHPMDDVSYFKILQEQEPDFSDIICPEITIEDLDSEAIKIMKRAYVRKNRNNPTFLSLPDLQALNDLNLMYGQKVTYAAVILLGKSEAIRRVLPQSQVSLEYRNNESAISFDDRAKFCESYFALADKLWDKINSRNPNIQIQEGPYIFDLPAFNAEAIREAINNAVAHRDYRNAAEVVIKQGPSQMIITNPGSFPQGVTLENIITVNSTPRNRRLAEVLEKTGIVERAGQGIDKIFSSVYQRLNQLRITAILGCIR